MPVFNFRKKSMKVIVGLLLLLSVTSRGTAQSVDATASLAARYFGEAEAAARQNVIWKKPLYGPILLVNPQTRTTYANMPDSAGAFTLLEEGVYKGQLPQEVMVANTSVSWQGRLWAVMLWPLPADRDERLNLMLHECFHCIQATLGLPAASPTADHLATINGRIYFLLELQALKAALAKPVNQRSAHLAHALLFRKKRQQLFAATFGNERILEMNEGLAEYTGMLLGRTPAGMLPHLYRVIDSAAAQLSLIRSMAYITGAVYGYLLYEKAPGWTQHVDAGASFPALISKYYKVPLPAKTSIPALNRLAKQYYGDSIIRVEKKKETDRLRQVAVYTRLFTHQPVLNIHLVKMNIVFNPGNLFDLGELGTVYPTAEIKDVWGKLLVTSGGVLMKNWKVITLPVNDSLYVKDNIVQGNGWKIVLNENWRLVKTDSLHALLREMQ